MTNDLEGRRILLTGARSGIGAATLAKLLDEGASVYAHMGRTKPSDGVESPTAKAAGSEYGDMRDRFYPPTLVANAAAQLGGLDGLVHVAGGVERTALDGSFDPSVGSRQFREHVYSALQLASAAKAHLVKSNSAFIVLVGSVAARTGGSPGVSIYAAAKAAVHSLTRSFATDFAAAGIRVNAIAPGVIDTPFHRATDRKVLASLADRIPLGRIGQPADCVGPICFLCSSAMSGYITGQVIDVNGGMVMP